MSVEGNIGSTTQYMHIVKNARLKNEDTIIL